MKIQSIVLSMTTLTLAISAHAAPFFQAGDIELGNKVAIGKETGIASYYSDGTTGQVEFTCDLQGQPDEHSHDINAILKPGKNFTNQYNPLLISLHQGMNGPFLWTLTDEGNTTGNIKVDYISGYKVTVQCIGKKRPVA